MLRRALRDAVQWGLLARNPCDLVARPRAPSGEASYLDAGQVRSLLVSSPSAGRPPGPSIAHDEDLVHLAR